jgi:UDP-N-acetylmuramoyl-L-alanyl-D-glutamate--2,6-diaminopimelate ligase
MNKSKEINTIGVIGVCGRTSILLNLLYILRVSGKHVKTISANDEFEFVLELSKIMEGLYEDLYDYILIEVSPEVIQRNEIENLKFNIIVIGNMMNEYLYNKNDLNKYSENIIKLIMNCNKIVLNNDDIISKSIMEITSGMHFTYAIKNFGNLKPKNMILSSDGTRFTTNYSSKNTVIELHISGLANVYNALAAIGVCKILSISESHIMQGLGSREGSPGRFTMLKYKNDLLIVIENPKSLNELHYTLKTIDEFTIGKIITIWGFDIDENDEEYLGMDRIIKRFSKLDVFIQRGKRIIHHNVLLNNIKSKSRYFTITCFRVQNWEAAFKIAFRTANIDDTVLITGGLTNSIINMLDKHAKIIE